jgi:excisionase family DNA binding protein
MFYPKIMENTNLSLQLQRIEELMNTQFLISKEILTVNEAAEFLNLKPAYLYQLTSRRKIPFCRPGRKLYFSKSDLIKWVQDSRQSTIDELVNKSYSFN